jgi:predicted DNA-binding protein (UPF0251 family)
MKKGNGTRGKGEGEITYKLEQWGAWKREYILGIGFKSSGLEQKIIEGHGKIYDSGCYGKGVGRVDKSCVSFKDSGGDESRIDGIIKRLEVKHRVEMTILKALYVMEYSKRDIATRLDLSRHTVGRHITRAKDLVRIALDL